MLVHRHARAIWQDEFRMILEFFDEAKNVVPAAAVQTGGMLPQFIENFIHLECGENRLDQNGRTDCAAWNSEPILREVENVIPQARLEMALHFRQVEVRPRSAPL